MEKDLSVDFQKEEDNYSLFSQSTCFEDENSPSLPNRTSRKLRKIPLSWIQRCPLETTTNNLGLIEQFQRKEVFPKVTPQSLEREKQESLGKKEREVLLQRVEVAKYFIQAQERALQQKDQERGQGSKPRVLYSNNFKREKPKRYRGVVETVLIQACKRMEEFIVATLRVPIIFLNSIQFKQIVVVLINCANLFDRRFNQTLFIFIRAAFDMPHQQLPRVSQVIKVYKHIQMAVKVKSEKQLEMLSGQKGRGQPIKTFRQFTTKRPLRSIWNSQLEQALILFYKQTQNFRKINQKFIASFPRSAEAFSSEELKYEMDHILRRTLRLVQKEAERYEDLPKILRMSNPRVRQILRNSETLYLRLSLLEVSRRGSLDDQELLRIIEEINEYLRRKQGEESENERTREPPAGLESGSEPSDE